VAFLLSYVFKGLVSGPLERVRGACLNHTKYNGQESYLFDHRVLCFLERNFDGMAKGPKDTFMALQNTGLAPRVLLCLESPPPSGKGSARGP
jgi:hypothetical protein